MNQFNIMANIIIEMHKCNNDRINELNANNIILMRRMAKLEEKTGLHSQIHDIYVELESIKNKGNAITKIISESFNGMYFYLLGKLLNDKWVGAVPIIEPFLVPIRNGYTYGVEILMENIYNNVDNTTKYQIWTRTINETIKYGNIAAYRILLNYDKHICDLGKSFKKALEMNHNTKNIYEMIRNVIINNIYTPSEELLQLIDNDNRINIKKMIR